MASTSTTLGSNLRPNLAWCSPNSVTGLGGLGLLQLLAPGRFAKSERRNRRYGLCRAAQSSSSSSSSQRHVVITGGNTGIGKATAIELARQGVAVTIGDNLCTLSSTFVWLLLLSFGDNGDVLNTVSKFLRRVCAHWLFYKIKIYWAGNIELQMISVPKTYRNGTRHFVGYFPDFVSPSVKMEACRNLEKGGQAVADIVRASNSSSVRVMQLDLASFASIRQFAAEYLDLGLPLNSLVNNAGVMACPFQSTVDGFEYQLGVNHLGHFLLTALLLDKLKSSASPGIKSRVVVLTSAAERIGNLDFDDLNFKTRKYNEWLAYGQSKLANCLFSHELARRCTSSKIPVTVNCMHPGIVDTELIRFVFPQAVYTNLPLLSGLRPGLMKLLGLKTPEQGASTAVYLANSPAMEGMTGRYYEDSRPGNPSARAVNNELSSSLWAVSEELTGTSHVLEPLQLSARTASLG